MTDLSQTIAPKSDQLNSDDLIGGPRTVTITKVSAATAEQPIAINFEGDNGKPYYPCKSMRRVMVSIWGPDGLTYPGKSMTLFREPTVMFGGIAVGGIRISHMTGIEREVTMALTASKAQRKPFVVKPLKMGDRKAAGTASEQDMAGLRDKLIEAVRARKDMGRLNALLSDDRFKGDVRGLPDDMKSAVNDAITERRRTLDPASQAPIPDGYGDTLDDGEVVDAETGEVTDAPTRTLTAEEIDAQDEELARKDGEGRA